MPAHHQGGQGRTLLLTAAQQAHVVETVATGRFRRAEPASLRRSPPGPPPDIARRAQVETALGALLDEDRTWTAVQLTTALDGLLRPGRPEDR